MMTKKSIIESVIP